MSKQVVGVRIELKYIEPKIWRRVVVPVTTTLEMLHEIIQVAFGWGNCHLWEFEIKGNSYMAPEVLNELFEFEEFYDTSDYDLKQVIYRGIKRFRYVYDFGDDWVHDVILGVVRIADAPVNHPVLVGGARCCPPEDVGGVYGYMDFVDASLNPSHEEHEELVEWHGGVFDPEAFHKEHVRKALKSIRIP